MLTQREILLKRLRRGWCTGLRAVYDCDCLKLSTRVSEFRRDGYTVLDKWVEQDGKRFKAYRIAGKSAR